MNKIINYIMIYLIVIMPFLFFLYYVVKKAIKDGLFEYDKEKGYKK